MACVNKMRAGQQQGPSAMSSETATINLYRDTDFSHTICGSDTMSGGRVEAKKWNWEDTVQYLKLFHRLWIFLCMQKKIHLFHRFFFLTLTKPNNDVIQHFENDPVLRWKNIWSSKELMWVISQIYLSETEK